MSDVADKFKGATEQELADYTDSSRQRPGEDDAVHAARVRGEEADLVARVKARNAAAEAKAAEQAAAQSSQARSDEADAREARETAEE